MGSPVAPSLGNIFMAAIEDNKIFNSQYAKYIKTWVRFMDDVFPLWLGTEHEHLNTMHELLKFTVTKDVKEVCYLDVKVTRMGNGYILCFFQKKLIVKTFSGKIVSMPPKCLEGYPTGNSSRPAAFAGQMNKTENN